MHPELRQELSEAEWRSIEPAFEKVSNLLIFEKLAGGRLPTDTKGESFEFVSHNSPAGGKRITLGSPWSEPGRVGNEEHLPYDVTLTKPFEMQGTPVTQLQWSLVMGENPSDSKAGGTTIQVNGRDIQGNFNRPVEGVSWNDVQMFIQKLNAMDPKYHYRLPTEAEWEYAVRAGTDTPYSYGPHMPSSWGPDTGELGAYGWYIGNSDKQTHDVASLKPNPNGLYDMHGNVWEWIQDLWDTSSPPPTLWILLALDRALTAWLAGAAGSADRRTCVPPRAGAFRRTMSTPMWASAW